MLIKELHNYSSSDYFVLDVRGRRIFPLRTELVKDAPPQGRIEYKLSSLEIGSTAFDYENYETPAQGMPTLIAPMGLIIYVSQAELEFDLLMHDNESVNVFISHLTKRIEVEKGANLSLINYNAKDYFFIHLGEVFKIPRAGNAERIAFFRKNGITSQDTEYKDYLGFNVSTFEEDMITGQRRLVNRNTFKGFLRIIDHEHKNDPIFVRGNGFWCFQSKEAAEDFLVKFNGDFLSFLEMEVEETNQADHKADIEKLTAKHKKERANIMRNAIILAGTTITGVIIEKLIEYLIMKGESGPSKKLFGFL